MSSFSLEKVQSALTSLGFDCWAFYDFRGSNSLALEILGFGANAHLTRRFFYLVPAQGEPIKIVNGIETHNLKHLPGSLFPYDSHEKLTSLIKTHLGKFSSIAMEYSPMNAIPYVSKVDAGTIELLHSLGINPKSSADLITRLSAVWSEEQYNEYLPVADALTDIVKLSFAKIKDAILAKEPITEYDVQQFIMAEFETRGYETDFPPIVGVNENSANPHYGPDKDTFKQISEGDFVLIDLWARQKKENAVWADITWTGYVGSEIPEKYEKVFNIVRDARNAGFNLVKERFAEGKPVRGFEVDAITRSVIAAAGYSQYFIHRTGHSITTSLHGSGTHMDNFETKDERLILPGTSFSIEPGIYLTGDFGVRSEIDVYIHPDGTVEQTGGAAQESLIAILA